MKKAFSVVLIMLAFITTLSACAPLHSAKPGEVSLYISSKEEFLPGYSANADIVPVIGVLDTSVDEQYQPPETLSLTFREQTYATSYLLSSNLFMRNYVYDVYVYRHPDTSQTTEFHVARGTDGKIVGYRHNDMPVSASLPTAAKTEAELTQTATAALGELTDTGYYQYTSITTLNQGGSYGIRFYNKIGDIEVADSSYVELAADGSVIEVEALPEPAILKAARFSGLDAGEFDAALEAELRQSYPDSRRDNEQLLGNVTYEGMGIKSRLLSVDGDGKPVVLYYVTPRLNYDITYRGDYAKTAAEKGLEAHQTGISEPPVFAAVSAE